MLKEPAAALAAQNLGVIIQAVEHHLAANIPVASDPPPRDLTALRPRRGDRLASNSGLPILSHAR